MLRQTGAVFLVLILLMGTASAQPNAQSKSSGDVGYSRPPMDIGAFLGGGINGKMSRLKRRLVCLGKTLAKNSRSLRTSV